MIVRAVAITACMLLFSSGMAESQEPPGELERLQRQIELQGRKIDEMAAELAEQRGVLRRLPDVGGDATSDAIDETVDMRLDRLENTLLDIEGETQGFFDEFARDRKLIVNGRVHVDQWGFPKDSPGVNVMETGVPTIDPQDRLLFRRIRIGLRGTVPPGNMSYRLEIEFSGQDSTFRDLWLGWDDLAWFDRVRIGNQKRPYGLDHLHSSNYMVFLERPFVVDAFNEDNRRFGLASNGVSDDLRYNWRYGLFNQRLIQRVGEVIGDKYAIELAGRLASTWWYDELSDGRGYAHFGIAGTAAFPNENAPLIEDLDNRARFRTLPEGQSTNQWLDTGRITGGDSYQLLGIESVINLGNFQVGGEFMNIWLQRKRGFGQDIYLHGAYLYASYFLTGEHIPWDRRMGVFSRIRPLENFFHVRTCDGRIGSGLGAWQVAGRLSYADFNDADIFGGRGRSATVALNWYWNANARLQFNYIFGRIDDRQAPLLAGGTAIVSGDYQISGVRFMIDF
jgi:phosphate-selective porin OprO/OprP